MEQLVKISAALVTNTLQELAVEGSKGNEKAVIWFGKKDASGKVVESILAPHQIDEPYSFTITERGMQQIFDHIREFRFSIVAQVHSHPKEAFHSPVDDRRAIVRHEGALSIVLPEYCVKTTLSSFIDDIVVYALDNSNVWQLQPSQIINIQKYGN